MFDALIYNADRTEIAPNLFKIKNTIMIFDHEKAFNFLSQDDIDYPKDFDFRLPNNNGRFLRKHFFYPRLKTKKGENYDQFIDNLIKLDDTTIDNIFRQIPYPLSKKYSNEIIRIKEYLQFTRDNYKLFLIGVMRELT